MCKTFDYQFASYLSFEFPSLCWSCTLFFLQKFHAQWSIHKFWGVILVEISSHLSYNHKFFILRTVKSIFTSYGFTLIRKKNILIGGLCWVGLGNVVGLYDSCWDWAWTSSSLCLQLKQLFFFSRFIIIITYLFIDNMVFFFVSTNVRLLLSESSSITSCSPMGASSSIGLTES